MNFHLCYRLEKKREPLCIWPRRFLPKSVHGYWLKLMRWRWRPNFTSWLRESVQLDCNSCPLFTATLTGFTWYQKLTIFFANFGQFLVNFWSFRFIFGTTFQVQYQTWSISNHFKPILKIQFQFWLFSAYFDHFLLILTIFCQFWPFFCQFWSIFGQFLVLSIHFWYHISSPIPNLVNF